jgi:hypothetical protein
MFSVCPGGKIPVVFGVEGVADDDFPGSIRATLLEVITLCDLIIVMAGSAGLPGTVRQLALGGERISMKIFQNNLLMQWHLGRNGGGIGETENTQECR